VPGAEVYRRSWRSTVKWSKVLFIAGALALFASAWVDEAIHQPVVTGFAFFFVLASTSVGLYREAAATANRRRRIRGSRRLAVLLLLTRVAESEVGIG
jgi:hypothetical protein